MNYISNQLLSGLNPVQQEAVKTTDGPLLLMAGAGSGKTRVLTHRIAYLMAEKHVAPWNILAITFTNKAAREMKERVESILGPGADDIWISTFHSMCVRILRRDIDRIGINRNFSILDTADQLSVIKGILKERNLDPKKFDPRSILGTISSAKNELTEPEEFSKVAGGYYDQVVSDVYADYQKKLLKNQSLDFDDLIMTTIKLFDRVPEVLEFYQRKFQYIHVDEYQDTNRAQYMLVKQLAERFQNLCVVGDSDQSIYRWRGADITNILSFEKDYPNASVILLEQNYRSTKRILRAANEVIKNNSNRKPKNLWTENDEGIKISYYRGDNEFGEGQFVAGKIHQLHSTGKRKLSDIAILYRTNAQSRVIEETLLKAGLNYNIVGGTKFYDRKEIKDILAYLRLVSNPDDDISFTRIVNVPKRGVGATSLEKIASYAAINGLSFFQAIQQVDFIGVSAKAANALDSFRQMIENLTNMQDYLSITELTEEILDKTEYREMLKAEKSIEAQSRLENIDEFLSVTKNFEQKSEDKTLVAFLTDLALIADIDQLDQKEEESGGKDAITLMTLHAAKGLEFPVVFLMGLEEGVFPHSRSLMEEAEMEEERRLAYVGITRAEQELYLTNAKMRTLFGRTNMNPESRFIAEIPDDLLENLNEKKETRATSARKMQPRRGPVSRPVSYASKTGGDTLNWAVGDKAGHKKWGTGTVVSVKGEGEGTELDIAFPSPVGVKRLLAAFAPIEKQ
ncbi:DNA helicase PcrA [Bacillus subtilis]|uniref:ATP-dependent DNA helicase PcrA n=5 Tax=Bacillales TaxID=1385 RepID=PCRA_BACSU|nr:MULTISPECIES: DNA helicase PcrA [Bacillales]NP_388543.1 ATP-dependent DNA helicase [Bacillus subtilis subsp. subtilis str. 168]O34580.1 RecName: Full=ATP-dependent DNA helicase PcrA; AltName: Full=DNA 3'-5' helicase PcrA [Bacillus subtilis subsp. subtilis str. 168]AXC51953.1 DNA helicase PcrA [Bacillus spizizenii]MBW4822932.1 DNA helicase PcrA [Bacillaceae bacterium]MUG03055.1 DNA helicase PcrA [Bacillus tequilensis]BAM49582.1 ATP-dependent DNA helicase [Bacillus subtilis BEST7613]AFQ5658